jgi:hypothetical protein
MGTQARPGVHLPEAARRLWLARVEDGMMGWAFFWTVVFPVLFVIGVAAAVVVASTDPNWCANKGGVYGQCHESKRTVCCYAR